ncbi:MAG: 30S ribosomal protein S19e [Candidatus Nanoarchaeia archaeon]|jgi:small subunit ribosomal protein S19e
MTGVFDVNQGELVNAISKILMADKELTAPEWTVFVKTGADKERPPESKDWWYVRMAAILRNLYVNNVVGVQRLRTKFGSRRKRGYRPKKHMRTGGKIIRTALQLLEKQGLVVTVPKKGRMITNKGKSLLDKTAAQLVRKA